MWREVDDEIIVLDTRSWTYVSVNDSGGLLWPRLVGGSSVDDLIAALTQSFGIGSDQARADVERFLGALDERGLIER